jgi:hypothetical protein
MIRKLSNLSAYLIGAGLADEARKTSSLVRIAGLEGPDDELSRQLKYFRVKINGRPGYLDKGTGRVKPASLPQPLSVLAERHNGWSDSQLLVYPHLKSEAVTVLIDREIQVNWADPKLENSQYMYFDLLNPDGRHLYEDDELIGENRSTERLAAEKTASYFPNYFIESDYLISSFPELVRVAEEAKSNEAYVDSLDFDEEKGHDEQ